MSRTRRTVRPFRELRNKEFKLGGECPYWNRTVNGWVPDLNKYVRSEDYNGYDGASRSPANEAFKGSPKGYDGWQGQSYGRKTKRVYKRDVSKLWRNNGKEEINKALKEIEVEVLTPSCKKRKKRKEYGRKYFSRYLRKEPTPAYPREKIEESKKLLDMWKKRRA